MTTAPDGLPPDVLGTVLIRAEGVALTRGEVLRWASERDPAYRARAARRQALGALPEEVEAEAVEEAAADFRYDRGLEDVEQLEAWLAARGLTLGGWWESLRRTVLEERLAGLPLAGEAPGVPAVASQEDADTAVGDEEPAGEAEEADDDGETEDPADDDEVRDDPEATSAAAADEGAEEGSDGVELESGTGEEALDEDGDAEGDDEEVLRADLVLTDVLTAATHALARRVAVALAVGRGLPRGGDAFEEWAPALEAVWEAWAGERLTPAALAAEVDRERFGWLVVDFEESRWATEDAAREAIACVRLDGLSLASVAEEVGIPVRRATRLLADAGPVRDTLIAAAPGEVAGPLALGGSWTVLQVYAKHPPTLDHPLVRAAAEEAVVRRAATPLMTAHLALPVPEA